MRVRSYFIIAFCLFADVERRETSVKIVADVVRKRVMGVSESLINSNHIGKEEREGRTTDSQIITFHRDNKED